LLLACAALLLFAPSPAAPPDIPIVMMLISGLAFVASFLVISIACDYRYLLFLDIASLAAVFYIAPTIHDGAWPGKNGCPNGLTDRVRSQPGVQ
jgi:hypothetical protein